MLIVLIGLLILFVRGGGGSGQQRMDEEWNKTDAFSEQMMGMNNQYAAPTTIPEAPILESPGLVSSPPQDTGLPLVGSEMCIRDRPAAMEQPIAGAPSTSLMGMMDANGREHIEFPANSGHLWYRDQPDAPWIKN